MALKEKWEQLKFTVGFGVVVTVIGTIAAYSTHEDFSIRDILADERSGHEAPPAHNPSPGTIQGAGRAACEGSHTVIINDVIINVIPHEVDLSSGVTPYQAIYSPNGFADLNKDVDPDEVQSGNAYEFPDRC